MRLAKALAQCGVASRRKAEELIFDGHVKVNGKTIFIPQTLVEVGIDRIEVKGMVVAEQKKVYYLLNKPHGYVCSHHMVGSKKRIYDLFPPNERLFSVGRLDRDTTGLLIVTNDGHFADRIIHPRNNIQKDYVVRLKEQLDEKELKAIAKGTLVEGTYVKPKRVTKLAHGKVKITVMEGKKREVRLLCQNAGLTVMALKRVRIGNLLLPKIPEGTYIEMTEKERRAIIS